MVTYTLYHLGIQNHPYTTPSSCGGTAKGIPWWFHHDDITIPPLDEYLDLPNMWRASWRTFTRKLVKTNKIFFLLVLLFCPGSFSFFDEFLFPDVEEHVWIRVELDTVLVVQTIRLKTKLKTGLNRFFYWLDTCCIKTGPVILTKV